MDREKEGAPELTIIVGVGRADYKDAIRALSPEMTRN